MKENSSIILEAGMPDDQLIGIVGVWVMGLVERN